MPPPPPFSVVVEAVVVCSRCINVLVMSIVDINVHIVYQKNDIVRYLIIATTIDGITVGSSKCRLL